MEGGRAPGPAIPELHLDAGDFGHTSHLVDDADLDDEVDALGGGDGRIPHRHLLGDAHQVGDELEGVTGLAGVKGAASRTPGLQGAHQQDASK
jgi:hypothetical protein